MCPLTTTDRGYPFHVPVPRDQSLTGFVMVEQIKSIDYQARKAKFIEKASDEVLDAVLSILAMPAFIDLCLYGHPRAAHRPAMPPKAHSKAGAPLGGNSDDRSKCSWSVIPADMRFKTYRWTLCLLPWLAFGDIIRQNVVGAIVAPCHNPGYIGLSKRVSS